MRTEKDLGRWLASHRPAPAGVKAILPGGTEHAIALRNGAHRWQHVAKLLHEIRAESVRLYDGDGNMIGSTDVIEPAADDAPPPSPEMNVYAGAVISKSSDVGVIVASVSDAISKAVERATKAQAEASRAGFEQLCEVTRIAIERLQAVEMIAHQALVNRAESLDEREEEIEETQRAGQLEGVIGPLIQQGGPNLVGDIVRAITGQPAPKQVNGAAGKKE